MKPSANLDIMRSIAVLAVLGAHSITVTTFGSSFTRNYVEHLIGRCGVLIFFVHTAFVLMRSMDRASSSRGWIARFYIHRACRIYPLSIFCVTFAVLFAIPPVFHVPFPPPLRSVVLANLSLTQNLIPSRTSLIAPLWSLPFEVQMYVILPAIFLLVRKRGTPGAVALLAVAFIVAIFERALIPHGPWITEFAPCFLGGVLAYSTAGRRRIIPSPAWPFAIFAILSLIHI